MLHPSIQVGALVSWGPQVRRAEEVGIRSYTTALSPEPSHHHPCRGGWKGKAEAQAGPGRKGGG